MFSEIKDYGIKIIVLNQLWLDYDCNVVVDLILCYNFLTNSM